MRKRLMAAALALWAGPMAAQDLGTPPAGTYRVDPGHTRVLFRVNHLGFSDYIAPFTGVQATLAFDPARPEAMTLSAVIDAGSVATLYPDPAVDFDAVIEGAEFLDAATHPQITFTSTAVRLTGADTAQVTGDLTLRGVTRPLTLAVRYNGGWGRHPMDPGGARIGFSATGTLKRSDFGMTFGLPAPGTKMGVADEVALIIETELSNPDAP
jgi:polyisoprenoid-binding protein YceI